MTPRRLPPDRDLNLRAVLALDASEQSALLDRMLGEGATDEQRDQTLPPGWTFKPLTVTTGKRASGALVWSPRDDRNPLSAFEPRLEISIWHERLRNRQQPRLVDAVAHLDANIAQYAARLGTVILPFAVPHRWTTTELRAAFAAMARSLPDWSGRPDARLSIRSTIGSSINGRRQLYCDFDDREAPIEARGYYAEVELPAIPYGPREGWRGTLATLDAQIAEERAAAISHRSGDDDDNDDLDAIERAARQRLHGDNRSGCSDSTFLETMREVERLGRGFTDLLERIAKHWLDNRSENT